MRVLIVAGEKCERLMETRPFLQLVWSKREGAVSVAPPGLVRLSGCEPRACALGYNLPPLRGSEGAANCRYTPTMKTV